MDNRGKTGFRFNGRRYASELFGVSGRRKFALGEGVRATRPLKNDGTYPHKDIGEVLVRTGDAGFVIEIAKFRGEMCYTVEFVDRAVVIAARSRDLVSLGAMPSAARH